MHAGGHAEAERAATAPAADDGPAPDGSETTTEPSHLGRWIHGFRAWFGRHPKRNTLIAGILVVAVIVGVWAVVRARSTANAQGTTRTVSVTTGTMQQTVTGSGTIAAKSTEDLNFEVSGQVTGVLVGTGDLVHKDQVLARIDSASLHAQVAQAQASVSSAQSKLASDQDAGASSAQINADEAGLVAAQSDVAAAESNLSKATLRSPIKGKVSALNLTEGQYITSGSGSGSGGASSASTAPVTGGTTSGTTSTSTSTSSSQIQVISTGSYVVNLSVDDTQISLISKDDQATVTLSGSTDRIFGTVTSVGLVANTSSGVSSFPVTVGITGSPKGLYPGSSADVAIIYKQLNDVLQVSTLAITGDGDQQTVQQVTPTGTDTRVVTTGVTAGGQTQILSGLSAGDQVQITVPAAVSGDTSGGSNGGGGFPGGGFPDGGAGGGFPPGDFPGGGLPGGGAGGPG